MSLLTKAKVVQSSDGTSIFAEAIGDPKNQSIVFAHGYGLSGQVWDNLFADDKLLRHFYLVRAIPVSSHPEASGWTHH